ncbi:MAG: 4-(cytidine 5'-diphospho)-2-C-methyl-D-erythritol kinase [Thermodesulfobacteriota bacterium]
MPDSLIVSAPAKINLRLSVVGRRADGYHLLETLMVKLDWEDSLAIRPGRRGIELEVRGANLPPGEGNLVYRAAGLFFQAAGLKPGVEIVLTKNIPVAAGLGGGSSDAAATLLGLNRFWGRPLTLERLRELALSLGADVPFFLYPRATAWASGIGDKVRPGPPLEEWRFLLVNPGWELSTTWVYQNLKLTTGKRNSIVNGLNERSFTIDRDLRNDLEAVVLPRFPELGRIKARLIQAGAAGALMSGSGPTVFGLFYGSDYLSRAADDLAFAGQGKWLVRPARVRRLEEADRLEPSVSLGVS